MTVTILDLAAETVVTRPLTDDERAAVAADCQQAAITDWVQLRAERDVRLAASDWTELAHLAGRLSASAWQVWAAYRQALRDLPEQTADPRQPHWPTAPGGGA